jgi:formiminoglutamase
LLKFNDIHYLHPRRELWNGRDDGPNDLRFHQTIELVDLRESFPKNGIVLLGFCCDAGVKRNYGRQGASEGPESFRRTLGKLPSTGRLIDAGDIICLGEELEKSQDAFSAAIGGLPKEVVSLGIGGGHEIAWAHYRGLKERHSETIGIINIDAHFDLRPTIGDNQGTSGTSFNQIAVNYSFDYTVIGIQKTGNTQGLFDKASRLDARIVTAEEIHLGGIDNAIEAIDEALARNEKIYLSVCLDVFASPYAPGVSAPQPLGLLPWQVIPLLKRICASGKVVGIDIAELNPHYDRDGITAGLAASLGVYIVEELGTR